MRIEFICMMVVLRHIKVWDKISCVSGKSEDNYKSLLGFHTFLLVCVKQPFLIH